MGQLINRLKNFAKVQMSDTDSPNPISADSIFDADDLDLKRQIDEAARGKSYQSSNNENKQKDSGSGKLTFKSACEVLSISPDATIDEIKSAYKKLMMEYHPDKVAGLGAEIKEVAERKTKEINAAYSFLMSAMNQ
jgi:DnaJ-domain-containing protein 1